MQIDPIQILLERARGDRPAADRFARELLSRFRPLIAAAGHRLGDLAEAESLAGLAILDVLRECLPGDSPSAFFVAAFRGRLQNAARSAARRARTRAAVAAAYDDRVRALDAAFGIDAAKVWAVAGRLLPPGQLEILRRARAGESGREIAETLGIDATSVCRALKRAIARLRSEFATA